MALRLVRFSLASLSRSLPRRSQTTLAAAAAPVIPSPPPAMPPTQSHGVTLPSPTLSGLLPPLPDVWKRRPGNRATLLYERSMKEMLTNLRYLCAAPNRPGAPRAEPLHRMLRRVKTSDDFSLAMKGMKHMRDAHAVFSEQTAILFVRAAFAAGESGVALEVLTAQGVYRDYRVPVSAPVLRTVLRCAEVYKQPTAISGVAAMMWASGRRPQRETVERIVHAWTALGRLDKALPIYARMSAAGWKDDPRPAFNILRCAAAQDAISQADAAHLRATVLPDADALSSTAASLRQLLVTVREKLPAPLEPAEKGVDVKETA